MKTEENPVEENLEQSLNQAKAQLEMISVRESFKDDGFYRVQLITLLQRIAIALEK